MFTFTHMDSHTDGNLYHLTRIKVLPRVLLQHRSTIAAGCTAYLVSRSHTAFPSFAFVWLRETTAYWLLAGMLSAMIYKLCTSRLSLTDEPLPKVSKETDWVSRLTGNKRYITTLKYWSSYVYMHTSVLLKLRTSICE